MIRLASAFRPTAFPTHRRAFHASARTTMKVIEVPVRSDNYAYLLVDNSNEAVVVDPFDVKKVKAAAETAGVSIGKHLLTTHHHADHSGGNNEFAKQFPGVKVYGGSEMCQGMTDKVKDGDKLQFGDISVECMATPCHTQDSICYFIEDKGLRQRGVFTGDTLFVAGCGRFFEGTGAEMNTALNKTLAALPNDTFVYCGHEYTKGNVAFAEKVDPDNKAVKALKEFVSKESVTTGKFTIGDEKQHNPFMRLDQSAIQKATSSKHPDEMTDKLREMKNSM